MKICNKINQKLITDVKKDNFEHYTQKSSPCLACITCSIKQEEIWKPNFNVLQQITSASCRIRG